jgi:hypothetical protein
LRVAGDVDAASVAFADLPLPLPPTVDERPSEVLARLRRDER